jgi:putative LysE/RhtB family amino acid efflux pump
MSTAVATGLGLGFLVGAQVGPIWLLCFRSTARHGWRVGLAIGAGAAIVATLSAALGAAGAAALLQLTPLRVAFGVSGAAVLAVLGVRTLWSAFRVRLGGETDEEVVSARRALATSLGATASNPLTIASWAAIFSAASVARFAGSAADSTALVAAVGVGSFAWFFVLASSVAATRRRLGDRVLQAVDVVSGAGLLAFSGLLGWRSLRSD